MNSVYQYAVEGGYTGTEEEFAKKLAQEPLIGTTNDLTPTQVYEAVSAGVPVKVQYTDSTYGLLSFTVFNVAESLNKIVSQTIVYYNSLYILAGLVGNKTDNRWYFSSTTLAQKTDIPSALPNPNALTFTGAVTGSYDGSAPVTINIPESGAGDMKKLTFTGAATGEYDGTTDVSIDIPSDVYVVQIDMNDTLVNDFDELVSAIKSHKNIIALFGTDFMVAVDVSVNSISTEVDLSVVSGNLLTYISIAKNTKKAKLSYLYCLGMEYGEGFSPKSGVVYFDETTGVCSTKDSVSPIATASTAGIIKVGNGLSISADGTLSVTTATYYTGTANPVNTLGADGDLYLKTEG